MLLLLVFSPKPKCRCGTSNRAKRFSRRRGNRLLDTLAPNDLFGEMALIMGRRAAPPQSPKPMSHSVPCRKGLSCPRRTKLRPERHEYAGPPVAGGEQGRLSRSTIIILAIATVFLVGVTVVTGLVRTVHAPISTFSANPVVHPQAIGSLAASVFHIV